MTSSGTTTIEVRALDATGGIEWDASGTDREKLLRDARIHAHHYPEHTVQARELPYLGRWSKWRTITGYTGGRTA